MTDTAPQVGAMESALNVFLELSPSLALHADLIREVARERDAAYADAEMRITHLNRIHISDSKYIQRLIDEKAALERQRDALISVVQKHHQWCCDFDSPCTAENCELAAAIGAAAKGGEEK
jgi:hypothetical protein